MSDLTNYRRIEMPPEPWTHEDNPEWLFIEDWNDGPYMMVPDGRLQALADAWKRYDADLNNMATFQDLADLLDGLEEDDD